MLCVQRQMFAVRPHCSWWRARARVPYHVSGTRVLGTDGVDHGVHDQLGIFDELFDVLKALRSVRTSTRRAAADARSHVIRCKCRILDNGYATYFCAHHASPHCFLTSCVYTVDRSRALVSVAHEARHAKITTPGRTSGSARYLRSR